MDDAPTGAQLGPDFRRLLTGSAASNLGDGIRLAALPLLATTLTDDPLLVAGVAAATFLPAVLFGPVGGAVIDRGDRRRLLVLGQLSRAVAAAAFVAALLLDVGGIVAVYVLAVALGAGEVVVDGASQAVIPSLVPRRLLERANARLVRAQIVLDQLAGASIGGLLFALHPVVPFAVDTLTFLVGGGAVSRISRPMPPDRSAADDATGARPTSLGEDVREGFAFLARHPLLRGLAGAIGLANLGTAAGNSVLVLLVVDELGAGPATFGFVLAAGAVAGFGASLVAERIVVRLGRGVTLVAAVATLVVAMATIGLAPNVLVVAVGEGLLGVGIAVVNIPGRAVRQEVVPDHLLGRVVSSFRVLGYLGVPLGAVLGGLVTRGAGVRVAYAVAGAVAVVAVLSMAAAVRHLPAASRAREMHRADA